MSGKRTFNGPVSPKLREDVHPCIVLIATGSQQASTLLVLLVVLLVCGKIPWHAVVRKQKLNPPCIGSQHARDVIDLDRLPGGQAFRLIRTHGGLSDAAGVPRVRASTVFGRRRRTGSSAKLSRRTSRLRQRFQEAAARARLRSLGESERLSGLSREAPSMATSILPGRCCARQPACSPATGQGPPWR